MTLLPSQFESRRACHERERGGSPFRPPARQLPGQALPPARLRRGMRLPLRRGRPLRLPPGVRAERGGGRRASRHGAVQMFLRGKGGPG